MIVFSRFRMSQNLLSKMSIFSTLIIILLLSSILEVLAEPPKHLVVLAQGRSGSSFLSSWFNSHPDVTYFLEPCSLVYLKDAVRDKTGESCAKIIHQLFKCDFSSVEARRDQKLFIPETAKGFKGWGHQKGAEDLINCNKRALAAAKELRIGIAWAEGKVSFDKVIVLVRDPRAVINSRVTGWPKRKEDARDWIVNPYGWDGKRGFPYDQSLKSLCIEHQKLRDRVANDTIGKSILVEYEDLLRDPKQLLETVMNFAGLDGVPSVLAHVEKNTKGECEFPNEPFSLCRTNLPKRDAKWRKTLPKDQLDAINSVPECASIIQKYYKPNSTDEIRDEL